MTARLNYPAAGSFGFATYGFGSASALVMPVLGSGTASLTAIGGAAAVTSNGVSLPYSGMAVEVLDPTTNVISFTVTVAYSSSCSLTYAGSMALRPA